MGGVEYWRPPRYTNAHFAEEQRVCYELRLAGHTIREIAEITGMSKSTVERRLECEIRETVDPLRAEYKRVTHDRLEKLWRRTVEVIAEEHPVVSDGRVVREVVDTGPDGKPVYGDPLIDRGVTLAAIARAESLLGRFAKLHGLDEAIKVDATVTETTQADLEVQELIREAQAKAAADDAQLREDTTVREAS